MKNEIPGKLQKITGPKNGENLNTRKWLHWKITLQNDGIKKDRPRNRKITGPENGGKYTIKIMNSYLETVYDHY